VLVTRAGPGFVPSVTELALGYLIDLSRGISRATADYHAERSPEIRMGRHLPAAASALSATAISAVTSRRSPNRSA